MVNARRCATFNADFPDDTIWDDEERRILQTGGKNIAKAIGGAMSEFGCVIHSYQDHLEHCWDFVVSYKGLKLTFHLGSVDPFVLYWDHLAGKRSDHEVYFPLLVELDRRLRLDGRFHDLKWHDYLSKCFDEEEHDAPLTGEIPAVDKAQPKLGFFSRLFSRQKAQPAAD